MSAARIGWENVPETRRRTMRAVRSKNTKPELLLRSMLHRAGYRFRLHRRDLPGTPDLVFPSRRKVIEVRGCFWHGHERCRRAKVPVTRREYWEQKLEANKARDVRNEHSLHALGWKLLIVWECELIDPEKASKRVRGFLDYADLEGSAVSYAASRQASCEGLH